ncbi:hypothetical protein BRADI_2g46173v3 [Brachypodium distachyon]|uniref:Tyrosine specific protein phosphatases domain-containing protein n=1 Tax=Brachypodium distachyon TaxID=15368 RepID=A0A0Q3R6X1_BRADI|nr:hypothetical protein BRADI_2g46173v3 [Brachypodium distachyon]
MSVDQLSRNYENALHGGTTLVHCKAGRARSTTMVVCYLAVEGFRTNISVETSSVLNSGQEFITGSDVEGPRKYDVDVPQWSWF